MSNISTIVKWLMIGLVAVLAFIFFRKCSKQAEVKPAVEKVVRNTIYTSGKDSIVYVPKPVKVIYRTTDTVFTDVSNVRLVLNGTLSYDSLNAILHRTPLPWALAGTPISDTLRYWKEIAIYDTTLNVSHGTLQLKDTVTQNRITGRSLVLNQSIPVVKETQILEAPKKMILYFGIQAIGSKEFLPYASGVTLDLKLKSDAMIGIGTYLAQEKAMYGFSIKFPIRLKRL